MIDEINNKQKKNSSSSNDNLLIIYKLIIQRIRGKRNGSNRCLQITHCTSDTLRIPGVCSEDLNEGGSGSDWEGTRLLG